MPCLLKRPAPSSPGIVTFTHNELFYGVIARSRRVRDAIRSASDSGRWIFGIHIQGDCSHLSRWPLEDWQAFVMWPDPGARFLTGVPPTRLIKLNCVSFLPEPDAVVPRTARRWDLCVVSRASAIKRIEETLHLVRLVMDRRPGLRVNFIVPDSREMGRGRKTYSADVVRAYFEGPKALFSAAELRQISFISPSVEAFGRLPVAHDVVASIVGQSKFLLMWSHSEGTPRAMGEALLTGTPCITSARLRSGLAGLLASQPGVVLDDVDPARDADRIAQAIEEHGDYHVALASAREAFSDARNRPRLVERLREVIEELGHQVNGEWFLEDLPLRLCGHGRKWDLQFINSPALFFRWFERVESVDPYDEDRICGTGGAVDRRPFEEVLRFLEAANRRFRLAGRAIAAMARRRIVSFVRG